MLIMGMAAAMQQSFCGRCLSIIKHSTNRGAKGSWLVLHLLTCSCMVLCQLSLKFAYAAPAQVSGGIDTTWTHTQTKEDVTAEAILL